MEPDVRLYTLGDLVDDLHDESLKRWKKDKAPGHTQRAAQEERLRRVEVHFQYTLTGTAWCYVFVIGKRSSWDADYAYKAWVRPGNTFELAEAV